MWKRQELLNLPLRYEDELTEAGVIEGRLKRRLREEIHDRLRQGFIKAWATPSDGSPERLIDPPEWGKMEIDFDDRELDAIPWPFGGDQQISAWQRKNDPRGKIYCYVNVRFSSRNLYREFPLRLLPRRIDFVPLVKSKEVTEAADEVETKHQAA